MKGKEREEFHPVPDWLTKDYIQDKLQKYFQDEQLKVLNLDIKPATAKGENFASVMTRIHVEYKNSEQERNKGSYLVKTTYADNSPECAFFQEFGVYQREMDMYEIILPQMDEILSELNDPGKSTKLYANTIYVDRQRSSIIFEDLLLSHYESPDRIKRIDEEHAKLILCKLAKFHAAAAVLNERSPGIFAQNFDRCFFNRHNKKGYAPIIKNVIRALCSYVAKDDNLRRKYYDKLYALPQNMMDYGCRCLDVNGKHFMTLAHGDIWTTNVMVKYNDNGVNKNPNDVILIDFQFTTWCSPANDLHYFFNSSLQEDLRLHAQTSLLQYYYYNLRDTLHSLNFKGNIPSLFQFYLQFEVRSFYAVFTALIFQPVMIYSGPKEANFQIMLSETEEAHEFKKLLFENVVVQKYLQHLLPIFDAKGLLDVMD